MLISTVYLCLWCLLVEVFIGIQCDIKGHRGLGWYNRNAWWGANGQMRIGEKFLSSVANDWCNSTLRCACILLHPRGRENQVGFAQIKHLPNCWGGSFDFSLVSKVAEEGITWERPLDLRWAAASSLQIWNTHIKHYLQLFSMFELTRQNLSSRCDLCLLLQTLCWILWGNFLWERHITLYLCMGHQFQVIKRVGNFDKKFNMGWNGACKSVCDLVTQYANNNMTVSMTCQSRKSQYI